LRSAGSCETSAMIEVYSSITFVGLELDPEAITEATGLQPWYGNRRGDPARGTGQPLRQGSWILKTDEVMRGTIEDALDDLFERLAPAWPALIEVSRTWATTIECFLKIYDAPPEVPAYFGFRSRHVRKAAELGATLAIDRYDFREGQTLVSI
jgi:hypothetical protein